MSSRAILMASEGDPFTTLFALKLWQDRWQNECPKLYINLNVEYFPHSVTVELLDKLTSNPNIVVIYHTMRQGNGESLSELLKICKEDNVLLLENDGYIFTSGIVDEMFNLLGEYDVIGSPRGSCTKELYDREVEYFSLDVSNYGDAGPNYWPNFFFCKREDLLKTDLNFASVFFKAGDYCKELDYTFKEDNAGDTFVWTSIQLRSMGLKFLDIPQHKASPTEFNDRVKGENNWHPSTQPFKWIHAGSLSSGWGGYMQNKTLPEMTYEQKLEFENRCAWWIIASEQVDGFTEFKEKYGEGINNLTERAKLDINNIRRRINLYKDILKL